MKKLVNGVYSVTVNEKECKLVANRYGAFEVLNPNWGGKELHCSDIKEMVSRWNKLVAKGYEVVDKVSAPKKSLFTIGTLIVNGKEMTGRQIYSKQKSYLTWCYKVANNNFKGLTGEALKAAHITMEAEVKAEMKKWEADFLASIQ